jgi:hypothetical protein
MKRFLLIILPLLTGCSNPKLTVRDLIFPDYERPFVSRHNVDSTIYFGKSPYVKCVFGNTVPTWDSAALTNWKFQPVGHLCYDSLGRVIENDTERSDRFRYGYDSLGILNFKDCFYTDIRWLMHSTCKFLPDSLILYQYWTLHSSLYYTSRFKFNSQGFLVEEFNDNRNNTGGITRTTLRSYEYDEDRLINMTERICRNSKVISESTTQIYYNKSNILDSTVFYINSDTTAGYSDSKGKYKMVTYYDSLGLRIKSVLHDSLEIKYRHIKKGLKPSAAKSISSFQSS